MSEDELEVRHNTGPDLPTSDRLWPLSRAARRLNALLDAIGGVALLVAALVLTYSVASRYLFHANTDWQDEVAVFCIVGAVFLAAGYVQSFRGHIGIEAISVLLSPRVNRIRRFIVDIASLLFCAFFAWKSWTLFHEAWKDKQTTSSSFAPPLAIPYGLMALGMTLLALVIALQVAAHIERVAGRK